MSPKGVVDVWLADLSRVPESLLGGLSSDELDRASQLRAERHRRLWTASRAVLRDLLGRRLGIDPATLSFEIDPGGKPRLSGRWTGAVRFNLSHSAAYGLYAICPDHEVGVDVEAAGHRASGTGNEVAIARRILGEAVASGLERLRPEQRSRRFVEAWVAHEAAVKCLGVGLRRMEERALAAVWVTPLEIGEGAFAALAVQGGPVEVRQRAWSCQEGRYRDEGCRDGDPVADADPAQVSS